MASQRRVRVDDVPNIVRDVAFPQDSAPDRVGLEAEFFPLHGRGAGLRRLPLTGPGSVLEIVHDLADSCGAFAPPVLVDGVPKAQLTTGGWLTFEPGGQIEVSPGPSDSVDDAVEDVQRIATTLANGFADRDVRLVSAGVDMWTDITDCPQQLDAPRYRAMDRYFTLRGGDGARMMRHTCALQINLDLGMGDVRRERWLVANLVAPLVIASFACSPSDRHVSERGAIWSALDPTRTGVPGSLVGSNGDPVRDYANAALDADVLLVRRGADAVPGRPGWRLRDWLASPDPDLGAADETDVERHLTTLFFEVRPRGALELRSVDALPARWRAVPVVLLAGLLYDQHARREAARVLLGVRRDLPSLLVTARRAGVADPALCALAVEIWSFALAGARRLEGFVSPTHLERAKQFIDRFTTRGQCPADELRVRHEADPESAIDWAAEPLATQTPVTQ